MAKATVKADKAEAGKVYLSMQERTLLRSALRIWARAVKEAGGGKVSDALQPTLNEAANLHVKLGGGAW